MRHGAVRGRTVLFVLLATAACWLSTWSLDGLFRRVMPNTVASFASAALSGTAFLFVLAALVSTRTKASPTTTVDLARLIRKEVLRVDAVLDAEVRILFDAKPPAWIVELRVDVARVHSRHALSAEARSAVLRVLGQHSRHPLGRLRVIASVARIATDEPTTSATASRRLH